MSPVETMQIGKLIPLENAARLLADNDNNYFDLRWALRFCMESYVRLCIRIPHNISTWEREQEPDYGESCGKCGEISDQREAGRYEDADEADMPQYCDNCIMTKPPVMGAGDFIGQRWGVLFVQSSEVQALIYPKAETVRCRVLYDLDDTWSGGYCRFEVASEYESMKDELDKEGFVGEDFSELLSQQSRENYLSIGLSDVLVWKEDFESALQGGEIEIRKKFPMNKAKNDEKHNSWSGHAQKKITEFWPEYIAQLGNGKASRESALDFVLSGKSKIYPQANEASNCKKDRTHWKIYLDPAEKPVSWRSFCRAVDALIGIEDKSGTKPGQT